MASLIDGFLEGLENPKTGGLVMTVQELVDNQYGIPLRHYAQQNLFGATGLRMQVFYSIQGPKEAGKSTVLYDLMGDICGAEELGGLGGLAVLYELECKISPSILKSILMRHGEEAVRSFIIRKGMTIEQALSDINKTIIPLYVKLCPKRDKPIIVGLDSIGGSASEDTITKLKTSDTPGKGYYDKQHYLKYWCENQGVIFEREGIPIVIVCINQEREQASATPFGPPQKTITGGKAQLFKDGLMLSASKKALASGDGNLVYLRTTKTSFCDSRKIEVEFRWNKYGQKVDDAYEARFLWGLAAARCLENPDKGVGDIRSICDVKVSDQGLVTCPQLDLRSVDPDEFEAALMANKELLDKLYIYQKIEKLKGLEEFAEYSAAVRARMAGKAPKEKPEEPKQKPAAKAKPKAKPLTDIEPIVEAGK